MKLKQSFYGQNFYEEEGQILVEWTCTDGHIESLQSEPLAIIKDQPFGEESIGFYVVSDHPEYGLAQAVKNPSQRPAPINYVIDLGW